MIPSDNEALLSRVSKAADGTDIAYKDMVLCQVESELMGDPLAPPDSGGVLADELDSICNGLAFANRDTATMRQAAAALRALSRPGHCTERREPNSFYKTGGGATLPKVDQTPLRAAKSASDRKLHGEPGK